MTEPADLPVGGDWPTISLEEAGFDPALPARIDAAQDAGDLEGLHGVVLVRDGRLVMERYYDGEDEVWGQPVGRVVFDADRLHDMRSVSKSVVGLLYGIGLAAGEVPAPEARLVDAFPDHPFDDDPRRAALALGHVLTMTMGIEWNEDLPYTDPRNGEIAMDLAPDRVAFVLDRPLIEAPGSRWRYCGGTTAVLARLVARGAGKDLLSVARERLFDPIGIGEAEWHGGEQHGGRHDEPAAASGLRLRPRDLARIGQLALQQGQWNGRQVVPAGWLAQSVTPHADTGEGLDYGYQWWLGRPGETGTRFWFAAFGNGGQRLTVIPSLDMALVVTAGNYNQRDAWKLPVSIIADFVGPAIRRA